MAQQKPCEKNGTKECNRISPINSSQIIATSHDLTPNDGLVREIPFISGKSRLVKYYNLARLIAFQIPHQTQPIISKTLIYQPIWAIYNDLFQPREFPQMVV